MNTAERFHDLASGRSRGPAAGLGRLGLWLASLPYGLAVRVRNRLYDAGRLRIARAGVPVVSIGNLTLGGTGKTPCVEYVAGFYRSLDLAVAILSRGYGSAAGRNDEAMVLEENLPDVPHLQGADRVALAHTAIEELESAVLVLDDGFQHRRLARDLDVVLVDATNPWGHGHLFPRGLLREPTTGLRRAGAVVLTRCDQVSPAEVAAVAARVARLSPNAALARACHRPEELTGEGLDPLPVEELRGRPVAAFCGLGNPDAFRATLEQCGADVRLFRAFPDHHPYSSRGDVESLREWVRPLSAGGLVVTSQKDLVKLRLTDLGGHPLRALRIRLHFLDGKDAFDACLQRAVSQGKQEEE
jgi:tetraacyldisaccharide 4'-kinase